MKKPRRVLVGLKTPEHAVALSDLACRMAARTATVFLVHITELPDATPLDADVPDLDRLATEVLRLGQRVVSRSGLKVKTLTLRAHSAGAALLDELENGKIDLGVFGYHHRRTFGELVLGTSAQHLARNAPCEIVLMIPPRDRALD
jgi:nucleotide-binding universal stress UspA family protein